MNDTDGVDEALVDIAREVEETGRERIDGDGAGSRFSGSETERRWTEGSRESAQRG